ncbi:MAG TPA: 16S rRNA (adenine(1518)-N(6)/adenine(1519)-N(6))-dimethyltransferase RsmA, partial [bacterium]|nr:16S rRNA (adenine(1518)-N(6)/adenine(1519)-N(6))-dimethyltransferase RsmA [bacterium]
FTRYASHNIMSTQIALLKKYGLPIRGNSGQHLLIDPNIQRKIVDCLDLEPRDKVLEIGPGLGALTEEMLSRGAKVWAVEKDQRFVEILKGEFAKEFKGRLEIIHKDILKLKWEEGAFSKIKGKWKVISNLPYYITAPILFYLIDVRRFISKAVLTMQKEVADRLLAAPGSKDYGRLTLAVRYAADVRHLFDISPTCFTPQPKVDSSVLELVFHEGFQMPKNVNEDFLFYLIRLAFSQRRKTLLHILAHDPKIKKKRSQLMEVLESVGLSPSVRGESLLLKDYFSLAEKLSSID